MDGVRRGLRMAALGRQEDVVEAPHQGNLAVPHLMLVDTEVDEIPRFVPGFHVKMGYRMGYREMLWGTADWIMVPRQVKSLSSIYSKSFRDVLPITNTSLSTAFLY